MVTFEPLREEDLPQMQIWLSQPHVSRWWGEPPTLEQVRTSYLPAIDGREPTWHYIVLVDGRPVGMIQWYRWSSYPDTTEDGDIGVQPHEAGVDYFIGEADLIGRGIGPEVVGRFLDEVVFADPEVTGVRSSVHFENRRSWRCLEKLGFDRGEPLPHPKGHLQYAPSLSRAQRSAAGQTSR